ncbi:2-aminoethylphosphonate ABC transporter permease subunit [Nocardiopsis composta]|uniref:2-aminoethylphosphonate transport system permease protein n=1 Tax=Nocardiopsis composta TaxID=157465 RepID=A0A7W8QJC7_9ACTN|nr:2-aminoethylphosphonate ABC transporter permease subunit [Nocardiopsis composta]MBB5430800.1 2-aminoethylphosphonate transport system permease protein [Nocardiopsis composta]
MTDVLVPPAAPPAGGPGAGPAPEGGRGRRAVPAWVWVLPPVAALGFAFLYPLVLVVVESFAAPDGTGFSLEVYAETAASEAFRRALVTTVLLAVGATVGCLLLGFFLSLVIAFVPFPGARFAGRFINVFLAFPSFLITLSLVFVYGTAGLANGLWAGATGEAQGPFDFLTTPWGVLLALLTYFTPFVMRPLLAAFSQTETAQIEAAASLGARPLRIVGRVILPDALPALAAGGSLVLVLCMNEFGIILFTGAKDVVTLPMLVYTTAILESDYTAACAVAVVNIALSCALYGLYRLALARTAAGRGGDRAGA